MNQRNSSIGHKIIVGTKIKLTHSHEWYEVSEVHPNRQYLRVKELGGRAFKKADIVCFTNFGNPNSRDE